MSMRYADLLRDVTAKLSTHEWKVWRPVMPFVLSVLSLITCEPRKGAIRKVLQAMPRHPACALKSRLGMLYLLAMSQLVSRRIAGREAFHRILMYLQKTRIDAETSLIPGSSVLEDVEATFPLKPTEIEELVDLDRTESVSYYLTGIEYVAKYLLRHRSRLERDGSPASERVKNLLRGFKLFLHFSTRNTRRSRQGVLLWALRYSQLPALIRTMRNDGQTAGLVEDDLVKVFQEALSVIEGGYIAFGDSIGEAASRGARRALTKLQEDLGAIDLATNTDEGHEGSGSHAPPPTLDAGDSKEPTVPEGEAEILEPWTDMINDHELTITIPELGTIHGSGNFPDSPLADPYMRRTHLDTGRKRLRLRRAVSYERPPELSIFERRPLPPVPETALVLEGHLESMLPLSDADDRVEPQPPPSPVTAAEGAPPLAST